MTKHSETVVLSLPKEIVDKIESMKGDLPRSLVYRRLLDKSLNGGNKK